MDVKYGVSECSHDADHVHLLPKEMTRVEVDADFGTNRVPESQQRRNVVDEVQWMQFERYAIDAVGPCELGQSLPYLERLLPLALSELGCVSGGQGNQIQLIVLA